MIRRQQRFQPEVYLKKAENDIKRVQMLCSLAEPPWDGVHMSYIPLHVVNLLLSVRLSSGVHV